MSPDDPQGHTKFAAHVEPAGGWSVLRAAAAPRFLFKKLIVAIRRRFFLRPLTAVTIPGVVPPRHLEELFFFAQNRADARTVAIVSDGIEAYETILTDPGFAGTRPAFRVAVMMNAGVAYERRYDSLGNEEDYRRSRELLLATYELIRGTGIIECRALVANLVNLTHVRFQRTSSDGALDDLIDWNREFLACDLEEALRLDVRENLIAGLLQRWRWHRRPEDEDLLIEAFEQAIADRATPQEKVLGYLEIALLIRTGQWQRSKSVANAEKMLQVLDRLLTIAGRKHPRHAQYLEDRESVRKIVALMKKVAR